MLFPYNTDAPLYHRPFATIAMIVANVAAFVAIPLPVEPQDWADFPWALHYDTIAPHQWITNHFIHGDIEHLVGNMMFLWVFGLVVEGKIGCPRFLAIYLGIGLVQAAFEQTITYAWATGDGVSFGASAIIYGLMAMCLVWAPKNDIHFAALWAIWAGLQTFDVSILTLACVYAGLDFFLAALGGFHISTPVLHLMGFVPGFALAVVMLRRGWVDCEGWDLFRVLADRQGEKPATPADRPDPGQDQSRLAAARHHLHNHLQAGNADAALALHRQMLTRSSGWQLDQTELAGLAMLLLRRNFSVAKPFALEYLRRFPESSGPIRVELAESVLRAEGRPAQALAVLSRIAADSLPPEFERRRLNIEREALERQQQGELEIEPEEW